MELFGGLFLCYRPPKQPHDAMVNGNFDMANMRSHVVSHAYKITANTNKEYNYTFLYKEK